MGRITWTKDKAKAIYLKLSKENGNKAITNQKMIDAGYSSLPQIIINHWGRKELLELELGLQPFRIKWDIDMVKSVYNDLCIRNGNRASTQGECHEIQGLYPAISKFFNSKYDLDIALGYTPNNIPWTKDMIIDIYSKMCLENGDKPSPIPKSVNGGDMSSAIRTFFGTKELLDIEMGYTPNRNSRTKESIIEEYKQLCLDNGDKPLTHEELSTKTKGLGFAINRKFGSKMDLDTLIGYKPVKNYNWNRDTVKETYHKICLENGDKPISGDLLIEMGYHDLVTAFGRHFRKIELDTELGYDTITYWDKDLVKETYHKICLEFGDRSITDDELKRMGHGGLVSAIKVYYGGKIKLDALLDYQPKNMFLLTNGILVRSSYEVLFGNYLIHNNIPFKYDEKIDKKTKRRYDFLINDMIGNDVFVEIWGYTISGKNTGKRTDNYEIQKKIKLELYNSLNKTLISINGRVFKERNYDDLQEELNQILIKYNIKKDNFKYLSPIEFMKSKHTNPWDRDKVRETYHKLCLENGDVSLRQKDVIRLTGSNSLIRAMHTYWGGKYKLDMFLGYEPFNKKRTKEQLLEEYHELRLRLNLDVVTSKTLRKESRGLDGAIYNTFDSREDFYKEYGIYLQTTN